MRIIADQELGIADRVERAKALAGDVDLDAAAAACELSRSMIWSTLARLFASAEHPFAMPGSSLTGQPDAVNATLAIQALNVVAGTAGQPGGMSVTPDLPISDINAAAPSTFADALALIDRMKAGEIKVLLIHGANPVYDLPDAAGFVDAIDNVDTVISFNILVDETPSTPITYCPIALTWKGGASRWSSPVSRDCRSSAASSRSSGRCTTYARPATCC